MRNVSHLLLRPIRRAALPRNPMLPAEKPVAAVLAGPASYRPPTAVSSARGVATSGWIAEVRGEPTQSEMSSADTSTLVTTVEVTTR